jgi:enoyl-CoA hydratase/carnithine racemase
LDDSTDPAERINGRRSSDFHFDDLGGWIGPKSCDLWLPVIAAVNGIACGGAFYMLGEADIVIAAESATFFDPHVTFGLTAAYESIHMLQKMPFHEVARMALVGASERMSARRAYEIGFVTDVIADDELGAKAAELAATIASFPTVPVQATVRSLWLGKDLSRTEALTAASAMVALGNKPDNRAAGQEKFASGKRSEWRLR